MTTEDIENVAKEAAYQALVDYTKQFWLSNHEGERLLTLIEENIKKNLEPFLDAPI